MADPNAKQTGQKSVKIAAGAVVCVESDIRGDVTIGARTVVHPKARIIAEAGPIVIGEGNLIEEQALIINRSALYYSRCSSRDGLQLPNTNEHNKLNKLNKLKHRIKSLVFHSLDLKKTPEMGCKTVEKLSMKLLPAQSNLSLFPVSQALKIGDNNVIESKVTENTVIYGSECLRRVQTERPQPQTLQLDFLMKILPNYHHLKKTVKASSTPARS
ncbi:dynactin subunit 6-like [Sinocyclocheilus rhinocerous]|uniref:dynactin subunit 6-like n=1 Tax=Sinocyclocheilus rhinocerous TaxID=307959 RepID=UPI0007B94B95|nr:PREDICTED: dynactin subunit 6-like [Sinocyclocheilus rhinocerous]